MTLHAVSINLHLVTGFVANGKPVAAAFFGFLLALVGWSCWCAWRAIRDRRHPERYAGPVYWLLTWLVLGGGAAVVALGIVKGAALLVVFGSVGVLPGVDGALLTYFAWCGPLVVAVGAGWWLNHRYIRRGATPVEQGAA